MASSAATAVFGTAELLEIILLDVDNRTLLTLQRTCKTFKMVIKNSAKLQRKLFLRLEATGPGESEVIPARQDRRRPWGELDNPLLGTLSVANLTDSRCPPFHISCDGIEYGGEPLFDPAVYDVRVNFVTGQTVSSIGGEGSWRAMYPFRPGGYIRQFFIDFDGKQAGWFAVCRRAQKVKQLQEGLTLGEIFEVCFAHARKLVDFKKVIKDGAEQWVALRRKGKWEILYEQENGEPYPEPEPLFRPRR